MEKLKGWEISELVSSGKVSCSEVSSFFLQRLEKLNPGLNAVISVCDPLAPDTGPTDASGGVDANARNLTPVQATGKLAGVPILIKDLICTKGVKTTAGSKMLANFVPPYDATLVERLKKHGAVVVGKANLDEFAMGSSNETSYFGPCKNPWNPDYVPGGSSGGSAAAVAAGLVPVSIGTDTGGSIRQPSSFCGVYGIKPTYGRISRFGVISYASSLDQAGPLARSVKDCALALEIMCGKDEKDSTSSSEPVPEWSELLSADLRGRTVGVVKQFEKDLQPEVQKFFAGQLKLLEEAGVKRVDFSLPLVDLSVQIYYLIAMCEASSNLSRYDGVRFGHRADFGDRPPANLEEFYKRNRSEGFGEEVKRRVMLGAFALSSGYFDAYYLKASQIRRLLREQLLKALGSCDVIFAPSSSTLPFRLGEKIEDPMKMLLNDKLTTFVNLAGLPAMNIPAGLVEGLPVGMQIVGKDFDEQTVLNFAGFFERANPEISCVR